MTDAQSVSKSLDSLKLRFKGIVQPKINIVIIYTPSCYSKLDFLFLWNTQKKKCTEYVVR